MMEANLARLLFRVNKLIELLPAGLWEGHITSGYRPGKYNIAAGGAPTSAHLVCEAVDLADPAGKIDQYLDANPHLLIECDLFREHPTKTPGWVHLDIRKRPTRTFMP
jgi:hypothetical protein